MGGISVEGSHSTQVISYHALIFIITAVCACIAVMITIILKQLEKQKRFIRAAMELNRITNSVGVGFVNFILEGSCPIVYASKGFYDLLGYSRLQARKENKSYVKDFVHPKDADCIEDIEEKLRDDKLDLELRMVKKSGESIYVLASGNKEVRKDGKKLISAVIVDISEQKRMQERLMLESERYRIASELSMDILFEYDIKEDEMLYSYKYREMYGRPVRQPSYFRNRENLHEYVHPDDWGLFLDYCNKLATGSPIIEAQFRIKNSVNVFIWCQFMGKTIYDDERNALKVIGKIVNIDSQKRELEAMEYRATRDPLTGVYNKEVTIKKIDMFINGNKQGLHALMFLDFDNFKKINSNYGHLTGDKVLTYIIKKIKSFLSEGEIIGRIGGDEFIIFAGYASAIDEIRNKAEALLAVLRTGYSVDDSTIPITASIGIALYPQDGLHYEQLVQHADMAMYKAKAYGKDNLVFYSDSI